MSCKEITKKIKANIENKNIDYEILKVGMQKMVELAIEEHTKECIELKYNLSIYVCCIQNDFITNWQYLELYENFNH